MMDGIEEKMVCCRTCGENKSVDDFSPNGLKRKECRSCISKNNKKYRESNSDKVKKQKKEYYEANRDIILEDKKQYAIANSDHIKEYQKQYREDHKEEKTEYNRQYYINNKEEIEEYKREYAKNNKEVISVKNKKYREENREELLEYQKEYREANKDKLSIQKQEYINNRKKYDPAFKLRGIISSKIGIELKKQNSSKFGNSIKEFLQYSMEELKIHLENLFESWMTWENHGKYNVKTWDDNDSSTWTWQIDHIIPQADLPYTSMEDENFKKCWALENLRPLSAKQNILDGAKRVRHQKNK